MTVPWLVLVLVALAIIALALIIWAILVWRRRRAAAAPPRPAGPSAGERLRALWEPFYRGLPARARHYPTIVVVGEAGAGKSHAIASRVDWRGQTKQFMSSVDHGAAMQLYLGPDVVVHELSAAVLRDVGSEVKRSLHNLWRNMGPSATVVLVLDARTLISTNPQALRELAQLVRGKISLFPRRCREALDVRVYLSHLDQITGYEEFAAALGAEHPGLELDLAADAEADAARLSAAFDAHLAYALSTRSGEEFDRMVSFYGVLPELIVALAPLLEALAGNHEPFADRYPATGLYLGSLIPRSLVGDAFLVDRSLIAASIGRQRRRGLRGSVALAAGLSSVAAGLLYWHGQRVAAAEDAVARFEAVDDHDGEVDAAETEAANAVADAIVAMHHSQILWFAASFRDNKRRIDEGFEEAIREAYLEPRLAKNDRVELLYATSLLYASRDNELGRLIRDNRSLWAEELELSQWVVEAYIEASHEPFDRPVELPELEERSGREWSGYLLVLEDSLRDGLLDPGEVERLQAGLPQLRSPRQYEVLTELRELLRRDEDLYDRLAPLLAGPFDSWVGDNYEALEALRTTILNLRIGPGETRGWGLARLVRALQGAPIAAPGKGYELKIGERSLASAELREVILRSRRHELLDAVLDDLDDSRPEGGRAFFDEGARPADAGIISGYGGGPTRRIAGFYTNETFAAEVAPVLRFAEQQLGASGSVATAAADAEPEAGEASETRAEGDRWGAGADPAAAASTGASEAAPVELLAEDESRLDRAIRDATIAYAVAYRQELDAYYASFEFDPGSEVALPYVIKAFAQPNSWFTQFLKAVSRNAALELPLEDADPDGYYAPLRDALADYGPLLTLLTEDSGAIPGLEPYQGLMAALQKRVAEASSEAGDPEGEELDLRLSGLGALALGTILGTEDDAAEQVTDWLFGAGVDSDWWAPFLAPVEAVQGYGLLDIRTKVATAWLYDVRPELDPLLSKYPFDPRAQEDAAVDDLEAIARMQGELPGSFWDAFDRLIRPAMVDDRLAMLDGVVAPGGMLSTAADLQRMSKTLWNEDGERAALKIDLRMEPLPKQAFEGRVASMASLGSGGASIFGFNNRPDRQALTIEWWNQGSSVVSLTMSAPAPEDAALEGGGQPEDRRHRMFASGTFSFYRLLDRGTSPELGSGGKSLTAAAMARATRCGRRGSGGSRGVSVAWAVPVDESGEQTREVSVVLLSDPWAPFAIRSCR